MGDSPFLSSFLFLVLFFFSFSNNFYHQICLKSLFVISAYWVTITLLLKHRKEAEAGSAEEQPARNISGYLSIYFHQAALIFRESCMYFVSFIL